MSKKITSAQINEAIGEVARRATVDPEFRALALRDAAEALAKVTPTPFPTDLSIRFIDNSGPIKSVILPDPIPELEELSDVELEKVAGGTVTFAGAQAQGWSMA